MEMDREKGSKRPDELPQQVLEGLRDTFAEMLKKQL